MDKETLQTGILKLLTDMEQRETDSKTEFAQRLAALIEAFVKSATIHYESGLLAPNGAVTGVFNGKLV